VAEDAPVSLFPFRDRSRSAEYRAERRTERRQVALSRCVDCTGRPLDPRWRGAARRAAARMTPPGPLEVVARVAVVLVFALALTAWTRANAGDALFVAGFEDAAPTPAEASRFLAQATFGATADDVARVQRIGYEGWLAEQLATPASLQLPYVRANPAEPDYAPNPRMEAWFLNSVTGPDQLRQRVAFALSQVFVVSDRTDALYFYPEALASFYDLLAVHAFGDFRALLEAVTLAPAMGVYLSMRGNQKADPARGLRPDENYAREILQLFSIGLWQLQEDGTFRRDADGARIPTYDQDAVRALARVFTGWNFAGCADDPNGFDYCGGDFTLPMEPVEDYHDRDGKRLLDGVVLPAGLDARADLRRALDAIAAHPNVGPFIGRQLIQRLVTSNPSPAYVRRVARVFADNGRGARGDLGAVVRAILLDPEAREGHRTAPETFGKIREPILRLTQVWRAFGGRAANGRFQEWYPEYAYGQGPGRAPSVFNFYAPHFAPRGEVAARGLVAPELAITTTAQSINLANDLHARAWYYVAGLVDPVEPSYVVIDLAREAALAADPAALVDHLDALLMGGRMPAAMRAELVALLGEYPPECPLYRAAEALHLIVVSPQYAVQQ
jgi:uncharacterized protein (DUF1800 family)